MRRRTTAAAAERKPQRCSRNILEGWTLGSHGDHWTEAFLGALVIFLIQSLLAALGLTSLWLPLIYGTILVVSLIIGSRLTAGAGMRRGGA